VTKIIIEKQAEANMLDLEFIAKHLDLLNEREVRELEVTIHGAVLRKALGDIAVMACDKVAPSEVKRIDGTRAELNRHLKVGIQDIETAAMDQRYHDAQRALDRLAAQIGDNDPEVVRIKAVLAHLRGDRLSSHTNDPPDSTKNAIE